MPDLPNAIALGCSRSARKEPRSHPETAGRPLAREEDRLRRFVLTFPLVFSISRSRSIDIGSRSLFLFFSSAWYARRRLRRALAIGLLVLTAGEARAAESKLGGVKLLVPEAKGPPDAQAKALTKSLKKQLEAAGAEIVKPSKADKAKLKDRTKLVPVARAAGADYVLMVTITKTKWLYTANAILVNVASGQTQMDFKSGYYKPKEEAADRGERIARVTAERLGALIGEAPGIAVAPTPPPNERSPAPSSSPPPPEPSPPPVAREERSVREERPPKEEKEPEIVARIDPAQLPPPSPPAPPAGPRESASISTKLEREPSEDRETVRVTVGAGARLLHAFNLGSDTTPSSSLSYRLDPLAAFAGDAELLLPSVPVSVIAEAAFSPARFRVVIYGLEDTPEPRGSLLNLAFAMRVHFGLGGSDRTAIKLMPTAGLRFEALTVEKHPADVMHAYRALSPFLGLVIRAPFSETFEASVGIDGGFIASYNEEPVRDGDLSSGLLFGAGLGSRIWLSRAIGVAIDGRFDLRSISLSGRSAREPPPPNEQLTDVGISTKDLQLTMGLAFRI
jgi:hypothetical protein